MGFFSTGERIGVLGGGVREGVAAALDTTGVAAVGSAFIDKLERLGVSTSFLVFPASGIPATGVVGHGLGGAPEQCHGS